LQTVQLNKQQLDKLNKLRKLFGTEAITFEQQSVCCQDESGKALGWGQKPREKPQRLAELTKLLKLNEKDRELLDSVPGG